MNKWVRAEIQYLHPKVVEYNAYEHDRWLHNHERVIDRMLRYVPGNPELEIYYVHVVGEEIDESTRLQRNIPEGFNNIASYHPNHPSGVIWRIWFEYKK